MRWGVSLKVLVVASTFLSAAKPHGKLVLMFMSTKSERQKPSTIWNIYSMYLRSICLFFSYCTQTHTNRKAQNMKKEKKKKEKSMPHYWQVLFLDKEIVIIGRYQLFKLGPPFSIYAKTLN